MDKTTGQIGESLDNYINTYFEENADAGSDWWSGEEDFIDNATPFFKSLGFDMEEAGSIDNDVYIVLPAATKADKDIKFRLDPRNLDDNKEGKDALIAWMKSNLSTDQIEELIKLDVIPPISREKDYRRKKNDLDSLEGYECIEGKLTDPDTGAIFGNC